MEKRSKREREREGKREREREREIKNGPMYEKRKENGVIEKNVK